MRKMLAHIKTHHKKKAIATGISLGAILTTLFFSGAITIPRVSFAEGGPVLASSSPSGTVLPGKVELNFSWNETVVSDGASIDVMIDEKVYASFSSNDTGCSGGSACSYAVELLNEGSYEVRIPQGAYLGEVSQTYNDQQSFYFTVSSVIPPTLSSSSPSGSTDGSNITLEYSWNEGVYPNKATIELFQEGSLITSFDASSTGCNYSSSCSHNIGSLSDGSYEVRIPAGAYTGTSSGLNNEYTSYTFSVYTSPPSGPYLTSSSPSGTVLGSSVQLDFSWNESVYPSYNYFDLYRDGSYYTNIYTGNTGCNYSQNCSYNLGSLPEGNYEVRLSGGAYTGQSSGQGSQYQSYSFTVGSSGPTLSYSNPNGTTNGNSVQLDFSWSESVIPNSQSIEVYRDGSSYTSFNSSSTNCYYSSSCSYGLGSLSAGNYEIRIPAGAYTGQSGYQQSQYQSFSFSVSNTGPTLSTYSPTGSVSGENVVLEFSWSENVYPSYNYFDIYKDGSYYTNVYTGSTNCYYSSSCSYNLGTLPPGEYEVRIQNGSYTGQSSGYGNDYQSYSFTVSPPPPPTIISSSPNGTVGAGVSQLDFSWNESVYANSASISVIKDGASFTTIYAPDTGCSYSSACSYGNLGTLEDGVYEVQIPAGAYYSTTTGAQTEYQSFTFTVSSTDSDGDGVYNFADSCQNTTTGLGVNSSGCPTVASIVAAAHIPANGGFDATDLNDVGLTAVSAQKIAFYEHAIAQGGVSITTLALLQARITSVNADLDMDTILDGNDLDIDGDGIINYQDNDVDGDMLTNANDTDDDGDGVVDGSDTSPTGKGTPTDFDADGVQNASDIDLDGDGVVNTSDTDTDGDGIVNGTDIDDDADGTLDQFDASPLGAIPGDADGDGKVDATENGGFNDGDGNGDGIQDSAQLSVAGTPNPILGGYSTIEATGTCTNITQSSFVYESSLSVQDSAVDYPAGLAEFRMQCGAVGQSATIRIVYDRLMSTTNWRYKKFDASGLAFADITDLVTFGTATIGGTQVTTATFVVTDGDPRTDHDGIANGVIVDPSGPALAPVAVVATTPSSGGGTVTGLLANVSGQKVSTQQTAPEVTAQPIQNSLVTKKSPLCGLKLTQNIRMSKVSDEKEVRILEQFLNDTQGESLSVNGIYERADVAAVKRFQKKYKDLILVPVKEKNPTGIVGSYTRGHINTLLQEACK